MALAALLCCAGALPARAVENKYDVLAKTLAPIAAVLAEREGGGTRALSAEISVISMTGLEPDYEFMRLELALESPDKLLLRGPSQTMTLVRDGEKIWLSPGARARTAIAGIGALPPLDPAFRLGPFRLPIPAKQLAFLPALFSVTDAGDGSVNGRACRVLALRLMPELARSAKLEDWNARLYVDADYKPVQLQVRNLSWEITLLFDKVVYADKLPAETWAPPGDDVLRLSAPEFKQLVDWALGNFGAAAKARLETGG